MGRAQGNPEETPALAHPWVPFHSLPSCCAGPQLAGQRPWRDGVPEAGMLSQGGNLCSWIAHAPPACLPPGSCWATRTVDLSIQIAKGRMKCVGGKMMQSGKRTFLEDHSPGRRSCKNNSLIHGHLPEHTAIPAWDV